MFHWKGRIYNALANSFQVCCEQLIGIWKNYGCWRGVEKAVFLCTLCTEVLAKAIEYIKVGASG